jgi:hypothetical protein
VTLGEKKTEKYKFEILSEIQQKCDKLEKVYEINKDKSHYWPGQALRLLGG